MKALAGTTVAFGLALASLAEAQVVGDWTLDPETYRSPSGAVELHVDPSQREGGGPGNYRCTRNGVELWSGTRPYTFSGACVADDGMVAGFAYGAGFRGGKEDSLTIALIAPDGRALLEETCPRKGYISDMGSPDHMVRDLFFDPDNDRLVVRVAGDWGVPESWWTYSLAGKPGPRLDPRASLPEDERMRWPMDARPVPGTGLVLVPWYRSDYAKDQHGAVFTLVDMDGQVVWRLDKRQDYTVPGDMEASDALYYDVRESGPILAVGAKTFTLREAASSERVTYHVDRVTGKREALDVREVEREPFTRDVEAASAGTASELPVLELQHLGTIELDASLLGEVEDLTLGPGDRIYALDRRTHSVHVFESSGKPQHVCVPDPADYEEFKDRDLTVTEASEVFCGRVHYDSDGTRIERTDEERGVARRNGEGFWRMPWEGLLLLGADGKVQRTIERTADRTWVRGLPRLAVAPDGSIALLLEDYDSSMATGLHLFAANGDPVRSLEVPPGIDVSRGQLAYDGKRIAIVAAQYEDQPHEVLLLEASGRTLGRFRPDSDSLWQPFLAAGGKELWLFDRKRKIERYALP